MLVIRNLSKEAFRQVLNFFPGNGGMQGPILYLASRNVLLIMLLVISFQYSKYSKLSSRRRPNIRLPVNSPYASLKHIARMCLAIVRAARPRLPPVTYQSTAQS